MNRREIHRSQTDPGSPHKNSDGPYGIGRPLRDSRGSLGIQSFPISPRELLFIYILTCNGRFNRVQAEVKFKI
jgi:hypothetical protein